VHTPLTRDIRKIFINEHNGTTTRVGQSNKWALSKKAEKSSWWKFEVKEV